MGAFQVNVARLRKEVGARRHELRRGPADPDHALTPATSADSRLPEGAEAVCDVVLDSYPGGIMVTGTVSVPWTGVCRRCIAPVGGQLEVEVRERFSPDPDDEAYPIVDDELDLQVLVHDVVATELPLAPLCDVGCRGLCPQCGADRNVESCSCVAPRDPRWASLDALR